MVYADFSGTWELDTELSDSPETLLTMQGVSWMRRKMAKKAESFAKMQIEMTDSVCDSWFS